MKTSRVISRFRGELTRRYGREEAVTMIDGAQLEYNRALMEYCHLPDGVFWHGKKTIFPMACIYHQLHLNHPKEALEVTETVMRRRSESIGRFLNVLMAIPGMKSLAMKLLPRFINRYFGPNNGFEVRLAREPDAFYADFTKCPYQVLTARMRCPELCAVFCRSDEYAYGALRGLRFTRTQTLGTGGEKCDFCIRRADR